MTTPELDAHEGAPADTPAAALSRRTAMATIAGTALGGTLAGCAASPPASASAPAAPADLADPAAPARRRVLRLAHLTDMHVQPERGAEAGLAAALEHAQSHADAPDLLLLGGDCIMDGFSQTAERVDAQWRLWRRTLDAHLRTPAVACLGNHDVWGWDRDGSGTTGDEPGWGKARALDELRMPARFHRHDAPDAGWTILALDSTQPRGGGYVGQLDEEQFQWLAGELAAIPRSTHVLVLSHIPILAACTFFDGDNESSGDWRVPGAWMHIDARRIKDLFRRHPNVHACLSGHVHLVDQVVYNDVLYCCNGAVCGAWWDGDRDECDEGYGLVDLFDDGTVLNRYVPFGWTPRA